MTRSGLSVPFLRASFRASLLASTLSGSMSPEMMKKNRSGSTARMRTLTYHPRQR